MYDFITSHDMWLILLFALPALVASNLLYILTGGYLVMFRAAYNDKISAQEKMLWMLVLTLLPWLSPLYLFAREKKIIILFLGLVAFGVGSLANYYAVRHAPWATFTNYVDMAQNFNRTLAKLSKMPRAHNVQQRSDNVQQKKDELSKRAEALSLQLQNLEADAPTMEQKNAFRQTDDALTKRRWEYNFNQITEAQFSQSLMQLEQWIANKLEPKK